MEIKHSRRILMVGKPNSSILDVLKDLTGSRPALNGDGSAAGITHEWNVETPYYTAKVPVWIDEIVDVSAWKTEFLKPEAKEVIEAVGAWAYCFKNSRDADNLQEVADILKAIQDISEEHAGYAADVVMLAVAVPESKGTVSSDDSHHSEWEDLCIEYAFEYVDYSGKGMNEFREKTGLARIKEALEANEWAAAPAEDDEDELDGLEFDHEDDLYDFSRDEAEMTAELFGMKAALVGSDSEPDVADTVPATQQESQVEDLDRLMGRLLAVKEQTADLPEAQRKRMAAQAVRGLMKDADL